MTVDTSGISQVLSRISAIQQQIAAILPQAPASTSSSAFASVLGTADSATSATGSTASTTGTVSPVSTTGPGVTGSSVVAAAEKYLGVPYVFGGTTTSGLDCSGLVQKAYGDLGISLPRLSWDQAKVGTAVPSLAQAQPGDILGFGNPAHHVAIYIGNNQMIAAPEPGENVKIQSVYETPAEIRRVVGTSADTTATQSVTPAVATGTSSLSSVISPAVQQYSAQFTAQEKAYNLPTGLLAAVAQTESAGNASAVSPAGAQGLMQLMPATAAGLGVNALDPTQAIGGAAKMLSGLMTKYNGSIPLTLAAYNAGPGAVAQYGGIPPYTETQNYVKKITGLMSAGG